MLIEDQFYNIKNRFPLHRHFSAYYNPSLGTELRVNGRWIMVSKNGKIDLIDWNNGIPLTATELTEIRAMAQEIRVQCAPDTSRRSI